MATPTPTAAPKAAKGALVSPGVPARGRRRLMRQADLVERVQAYDPAADEALLKTCFPCHVPIESRDFVFTHYSP